MIAGELESTFDDSYDYFLFGKKNSTPQTGIAKPKISLGERLKKVGQKIDNAGGIEGIGRTVDNVRSFFRRAPAGPEPPSDYAIGLQKSTGNTSDKEQLEKERKAKEKKMIVTVAAVAGGIIVIGCLVWYMKRQRGLT